MSLNLPFGTRVLNPIPVDDKAFNASGQPYTDLNEVKTQVTSGVRHKGLTVFVDDGNGGVAEYWWRDGTTDNDLVPKKTGLEEISDLTSLETYTGDATEIYVIQENAIYRKSNLKDAEVVEDGLNIIHSAASDYSWVRNNYSTILNIRDLYDSDGLSGTDDTSVFKKAFDACNDKQIYQKAALNDDNPHYDTVYIPEGDYKISETIVIRCNVLSSPNATVKFDQKPTTQTDWQDNVALFQIGNDTGDYAYDTDNYTVSNDPIAADDTTDFAPSNLRRWFNIDSFKRLGPITDSLTTTCVKVTQDQDTKDSWAALNWILDNEVQGHFKIGSFTLNGNTPSITGNTNTRGGTITTKYIKTSNIPSNLGGRIKILLVEQDSNGNPISGTIYDKNYFDDTSTVTVNTVNPSDSSYATYDIQIRVVNISIREKYQEADDVEVIGSNILAYAYYDADSIAYHLEPDLISKEENYHLAKIIGSELIQVNGSNERFIFFDQSGRFNIDESALESPYMRGRVRTSSESIVNEIKGYRIELPNISHRTSTNHWPMFQDYLGIPTDYSIGIRIKGAKNCIIKCADARFFSTYMHFMAGSSIAGARGVIGCTIYGGNCANNKRQIEILTHRPNGLKANGYVNSNRFVDFTMNWAADNHITDGAKQVLRVVPNSIVSLSSEFNNLPTDIQSLYPDANNRRLLCVKFDSANPLNHRLSKLCNSDKNVITPSDYNVSSGTLNYNDEVSNPGFGIGSEVYVIDDDVNTTETLWGVVTGFQVLNGQTEITINTTGSVSSIGTNPEFSTYERFDLTRAKPNYYMDLNGVTNALNRISEFRVDHVVQLTDGTGNYLLITNYGEGDPIYGDLDGRSQSTWSPESGNANMYVEFRYARLGSHPTHRDPTLHNRIDFVRKDFQLIGMYGQPQVGLGSPNGNGFYNCIFEEHAGLGYKHYDLIGVRYNRFVHIRAEVALNRLPLDEFRNTIYIDGCTSIQFDSGAFMEHSVKYVDTRSMPLPRKSDSIIFEWNNKVIKDLRKIDTDYTNTTIIEAAYSESNGSIEMDNVDVTYGTNSKVTINKKIFGPKEMLSSLYQDYNRQILDLKYAYQLTIKGTSDSYSVDVLNSNFVPIELITDTGVSYRTFGTNTYIGPGGSARFINKGNNKYFVSGDLTTVGGLSTTYNNILTEATNRHNVHTNGLTNEQKIRQDILIRHLEDNTSLWGKIIKLGIFGGMDASAEGLSLINWRYPSNTSDVGEGVFVKQGGGFIWDGEPIYYSDFNEVTGQPWTVQTGDGTLSFNQPDPVTSSEDKVMKFELDALNQPAGPYRIRLRDVPTSNTNYLDAGNYYRISISIYVPSDNHVINGFRLLTDDSSDGIDSYTSPTTDQWVRYTYVTSSGAGSEFIIRFIDDGSNQVEPDPTNPTDSVLFKDVEVTPLVVNPSTVNIWSESKGYTANRSGFINTYVDNTDTDNTDTTIFVFLSETVERAADTIVNADGEALFIDITEIDNTGLIVFKDPISASSATDNQVANTGFGVGSTIYYYSDEEKGKLGVVTSIDTTDISGQYVYLEDANTPGYGSEISYTTIQDRSNQVLFGVEGSSQKFVKLYSDNRTYFITLFNSYERDSNGNVIYRDTSGAQSLALTRNNSSTLDLFIDGVTQTLNSSFESNPDDPILIFKSNDDIADDISIGGFVAANALTEEELILLQELFEAYYSVY